MKRRNIALAAVLALAFSNAQAELFDRGGGLIYDDVLNVTWLQDANYASTSGYAADGRMTWSDANGWAAGLVFGGYDDWRLTKNSPVGAAWNHEFSYDGMTDIGMNITSPNSELAYMYYVNLGLMGSYSTIGGLQQYFGVGGNGGAPGEVDVGFFKNIQSQGYWSGTTSGYYGNHAYVFYTDNGGQTVYDKQNYIFYAWAVRDGDVASVAAPIPEPETYAMMLVGLGFLGLIGKPRSSRTREIA